MPNGISPSAKYLNRLGLNLPERYEPTSEERARYEQTARATRISPRQKIVQELLSGLGGIAEGFLGIEPLGVEPGETGIGPTTNKLTQLILAGLPLASITKGKPLLHGTTEAFERFNPSVYDKSDLLGSMTHFTTSPTYASKYAGGYKSGRQTGGNIIMAHPEAKNVLDLADPDINDLSQALAAFTPEERKNILYRSKMGRGVWRGSDIKEGLAEELKSQFGARPDLFDKTPFDAIRYMDEVNKESFAIPGRTPIRAAYGPEMTPIRKETPTFLAGPEGIMKPQTHPEYGLLSKKEAADLVKGGELSMSWYMKNFPD